MWVVYFETGQLLYAVPLAVACWVEPRASPGEASIRPRCCRNTMLNATPLNLGVILDKWRLIVGCTDWTARVFPEHTSKTTRRTAPWPRGPQRTPPAIDDLDCAFLFSACFQIKWACTSSDCTSLLSWIPTGERNVSKQIPLGVKIR